MTGQEDHDPLDTAVFRPRLSGSPEGFLANAKPELIEKQKASLKASESELASIKTKLTQLND